MLTRADKTWLSRRIETVLDRKLREILSEVLAADARALMLATVAQDERQVS